MKVIICNKKFEEDFSTLIFIVFLFIMSILFTGIMESLGLLKIVLQLLGSVFIFLIIFYILIWFMNHKIIIKRKIEEE